MENNQELKKEKMRTVYLLEGQKISKKEDGQLVRTVGPKEIQVNESDYNLYVNDLKIAIDTKDKDSENLINETGLSLIEVNNIKDENIMLQEKVKELEVLLSEANAKNLESEKIKSDKKSNKNVASEIKTDLDVKDNA